MLHYWAWFFLRYAFDSHICRYNIVVCHKSLYEPCFIQQNKWKPAKQALEFKLLLNTMEFKMLNKCILKKENKKACSKYKLD